MGFLACRTKKCLSWPLGAEANCIPPAAVARQTRSVGCVIEIANNWRKSRLMLVVLALLEFHVQFKIFAIILLHYGNFKRSCIRLRKYIKSYAFQSHGSKNKRFKQGMMLSRQQNFYIDLLNIIFYKQLQRSQFIFWYYRK